MDDYRMRVYIGAILAEGYLEIKAESIDDAEAEAEKNLRANAIRMDADGSERRRYFTSAITGYVVFKVEEFAPFVV